MSQRLPPELENLMTRYQNVQAQYTRIVQERTTIEAELSETDNLIKMLEEAEKEAQVYRLLGTILVRTDRDKLLQELKDRKEILQLRLERLRKQEAELRKQLDKLAQEIKRQMQTKLGYQVGKPGTAG